MIKDYIMHLVKKYIVLNFMKNTEEESHLTVKSCPGFVVEFNTYNITGDESHVTYLSLAGIT